MKRAWRRGAKNACARSAYRRVLFSCVFRESSKPRKGRHRCRTCAGALSPYREFSYDASISRTKNLMKNLNKKFQDLRLF